MKHKVGILAFGSLRTELGTELEKLVVSRIATTTPFPVEYGRYSKKTRGGAPTLVPHVLGKPVSAEILILPDTVSINDARDMLWRRECRKVGSGEKYTDGRTQNSVLVRTALNYQEVETVLYADFPDSGKIDHPLAEELAEHAIASVGKSKQGMDGITYLLNATEAGIDTLLSRDYSAAVLRKTQAPSLSAALAKIEQGLPDRTDGSAGERRAAAILTMSLCAESTHATLQEEGKKLDLKLSFKNPFVRHRSLVTAHCQVKYGPSFRYDSKDRTVITLQNIEPEAIQALQEGTQPALIVWVPPWPERRLYWYIVRRKGQHKNPIKIKVANGRVSPALRYDLCRFANFERRSAAPPQHNFSGFPELDRRQAKNEYRCLKEAEVYNPLLGRIYITRYAWRHITRWSRGTSRTIDSFSVVRLLASFLKHVPTRYLVDPKPNETFGKAIRERREIVFWYERAFRVANRNFTLITRFIEDVSYPKDWERRPLAESGVLQKATLMSWWFKPEKEMGDASLAHTNTQPPAR